MPLNDPFTTAPSAGQRFAERRTVPRYSLTWPVEIFEPIKLTRFAAQTAQVSLKGCYVTTLNRLDPGTIVRLQIQGANETVEVWARVTSTSADSGMGIAFLGAEHQEVLARWINTENNT
jgi:hypothetical protein